MMSAMGYFANHQKAYRLSCGHGWIDLFVMSRKRLASSFVQAARIAGFPVQSGSV